MPAEVPSAQKARWSLSGRHWLALGALGFLLRLVVLINSEGTNDIRTWRYFGDFVNTYGLAEAYRQLTEFNHPPLMGLWGAAAAKLAGSSMFDFARWFKVPSLIAELVTAWLVFRAWKIRGQDALGATAAPERAFAAYGLSLSCILISAYHGNTDALYFCLAFAAVCLLELERKPFLAGLALGAALNVKLIPVILILPLATRCRSLAELRRYLLGGIVGLLPFVVTLAWLSAPAREGFVAHVLGYRGYTEAWGVEMVWRGLLAAGAHVPGLPEFVVAVRDGYLHHASKFLIAASAVLAAVQVLKRKPFDGFELWALMACAFLLSAPGFGVQYLGAIAAPLLVANFRAGSWAVRITGIYALLIYLRYVTRWFPTATQHYPIPAEFGMFATVTWIFTAVAAWQILRRALAKSEPVA
jgi:hypothetical protein